MTRRWAASLVAVFVLSSCAVMQAQKDGVQGVAQASDMACVQARTDLQKALEAYDILNGGMPPNEAALVPDYLREESQLMDMDAQGNVISAPGSGCG
jgi:hypothetical protein